MDSNSQEYVMRMNEANHMVRDFTVKELPDLSISFRCSLRSSLSLPLYHIMRGSKESAMAQNSSIGISKMSYGPGYGSPRLDSMRKSHKGIVIETGMTIDSRMQDSR